MVSLSRSLVRQFRAVARRAGFTTRQAASVRIITTPEVLCLFAVNGRVAVAYREPGHFTEVDVTVPLQLFADCEKKSGELVTIRPGQSGQLVATWEEAGVPQQRVYSTADVAVVPDLPASPSTFADNEPELLVALRDAMDTTDSAATRYALSCVQLQGNGSLDATDGHQLLVQTGFRFGWRDSLLMEASDVFASRELPQDHPVQIGATADWVTVVAGRWTLHHAISKQGRFPEVHRIIPATTALATRLQLDPDDIEFLSDRMERLPADEAPERPVTVELNGSVAIRARQDAESPVTELVLSRSKRVGAQLRIQTNREFFIRAMDLGFTEMGFVDAETPCVCRDARRTYLWQMLTPDGALPAEDGARRIESAAVATAVSRPTARPTSVAVNRVARQLPQPVRTGVATRTLRGTQLDSSGGVHRVVSGPVDLLAKALELRDQLRRTTQGLGELVVQMRQQRKQSRLMKSTLQSLQQLKLLEA